MSFRPIPLAVAFLAALTLLISCGRPDGGGEVQRIQPSAPLDLRSPGLFLVVADGRDVPLAGVQAEVFYAGEPDFFTGTPGHPQPGDLLALATSDDQGRLRFDALPASGHLKIRFHAKNAVGEMAKAYSLGAEETRNLGVHQLDRLIELGGTVQKADGTPAAGVPVHLRMLASSPEMGRQFLQGRFSFDHGSRFQSVYTDGKGKYRFESIPQGEYAIQVVPPALPRLSKWWDGTASKNKEVLDLRLPKSNSVTGRLEAGGGGQLPAARYAVIGEGDKISDGQSWQYLLEHGKPIDSDGEFAVEFESDDYGKWLAISAPGHAVEIRRMDRKSRRLSSILLEPVPAFDLPDSGLTSALPASLPPNPLAVKLIDDLGQPAEGAAVTFDAGSNAPRLVGITDEKGVVQFPEVAGGRGTIRVFKKGHIRITHEHNVKQGSNELLEFTLARTTSLKIQYSGNKPQQRVVEIWLRKGPLHGGFEQTTDLKGNVEFLDLPPGNYFVRGLPDYAIIDIAPGTPYLLEYTHPETY
jgi:hypothetical protein